MSSKFLISCILVYSSIFGKIILVMCYPVAFTLIPELSSDYPGRPVSAAKSQTSDATDSDSSSPKQRRLLLDFEHNLGTVNILISPSPSPKSAILQGPPEEASQTIQSLGQASNLENTGMASSAQISPNGNDPAIMPTHCLSEPSPTPSIISNSISDNLSGFQPISSQPTSS